MNEVMFRTPYPIPRSVKFELRLYVATPLSLIFLYERKRDMIRTSIVEFHNTPFELILKMLPQAENQGCINANSQIHHLFLFS